ncbi:MAG: type I restriction enzyme HsdR N-terminal domain-containing protein [Eubacteriales bacterium]|nr:type I restriction enzyme HsdR N-terminal domain-containing protein [Eubacteriales bacterium]
MIDTKVIVIPEGKICDYVDGKFRNDTPEEYVRQTIEKRLVNEHKYSTGQIKIEYTLHFGSNKPRADIVIFDKDCTEKTQNNIKIIIECKKETVDARNAKEGVEQLKSYMSACPNCLWGMWTNGKQKEVFKKGIDEHGNLVFVDYNDIPSADGNLDEINRPQRQSLKNASDDNLLFIFKTCHNHIHVNDGLQKQPAFFELLKVIFCKIEDEKNIPKPLEFYATSEERSNIDGQLTVKKRISKIFQNVKKKYGKIFDANDEIKLHPRSLAYIVSELQKYNLLNTDIDIKGKAY